MFQNSFWGTAQCSAFIEQTISRIIVLPRVLFTVRAIRQKASAVKNRRTCLSFQLKHFKPGFNAYLETWQFSVLCLSFLLSYIHVTVFSVPLVTVSILPLWVQTYTVMFSASSSLTSSTLEFQGCMITLSTHPTSIFFFLSHSSTALKPQTRDSFQSPSHSSSRSCCLMLSPNPSYLFPSWSCCVMFSWGGSVVFLFPLSCWRGGDRGGWYKRGRLLLHKANTADPEGQQSQQPDLQESIQTSE